MTFRMGDGPVNNLPPGLDAYAGYADNSGIGETYPQIVTKFPDARHLSISVHGNPAECADVENGAMSSWSGYTVGYTSASNAGAMILQHGRPKKLWTAHYTGVPHICTSRQCWPSSPVAWIADGTQWTDHGGVWDESLLSDDFFSFQQPPTQTGGTVVNVNKPPVAICAVPGGGTADYWIACADGGVITFGKAQFYGSTGGNVAAPIVGMTAAPDGKGYWLLGADGGVFAFGSAKYSGRVVVA